MQAACEETSRRNGVMMRVIIAVSSILPGTAAKPERACASIQSDARIPTMQRPRSRPRGS
jgi:hypothetical protein